MQRREAAAELAASGTAEPPRAPLPVSVSGGPLPTLQMLFGVQRDVTAAPAEAPARVHAAVARGTATPATKLPYTDQIQRAFGRHDISGVQAHMGGDAAASAQEMGARAYATGDHVVLGEGADLHTAAHEAAHVVQQRDGVQRKGGLGEDGDVYERHADAVADRVVRGESAEALLDEHAGGGGGGPAIQRKPSDLQRDFGAHAQVTLSLGKRILNPGWNAYLIELQQYLRLGDRDVSGRQSVLGTLYGRAMSLVRERKDDHDFTDEQHELAIAINARLEQEKCELYGSTAGMLQPAHDVETREGVEPVIGGNGRYVAQDDPGRFPLFAGPPSMDDVQQGGLGDCFLLAAAASIVNRDPMHFVRHMADNLDGTVTVKLYAGVDQPLQVVIQKSVPGERFAQKVLWVKLLEKAYAASGLARNPGSQTPIAYKDIEGGSSSTALTHLTGKPSGTLGTGQMRSRVGQGVLGELREEQRMLRQQLEEIRDQDEQVGKRIAEKQKQDEHADISVERSLLEEQAKRFKVLMQQMSEMESPIWDFDARLSMMLVTQTSLREFIEHHRENKVVQRILEKVMPSQMRDGLFPEAIGTGLYGVDEQRVFAAVKQGIDAGKPMTAGTKVSISDRDNQVEGQGASGEPKVKGLAGKHAYTLLDYKPKPGPTPGQRIFLKLRNPWGNYGRAYEEDMGLLKAVAIEGDGTFWIDLADFVANFRDINWVG